MVRLTSSPPLGQGKQRNQAKLPPLNVSLPTDLADGVGHSPLAVAHEHRALERRADLLHEDEGRESALGAAQPSRQLCA